MAATGGTTAKDSHFVVLGKGSHSDCDSARRGGMMSRPEGMAGHALYHVHLCCWHSHVSLEIEWVACCTSEEVAEEAEGRRSRSWWAKGIYEVNLLFANMDRE